MFLALTFLVMVINFSLSTKVNSRYGVTYPTDRLCRRLMLKSDLPLSPSETYNHYARFATQHLNCSDVVVSSAAAGVADKFGNYSDHIGYLQRNEAEITFQTVRLDSLVGEPIIPGQAQVPADVSVLTKHLPPDEKFTDVIDFINKVDTSVYWDAIILSLLVLVLLSMKSITKLKNQFSARRAASSLFNIYGLIVGQENSVQEFVFQKIVWTSYCITTFVVVVGFVLNLMSTDQVALVLKEQVDSIDDLLLGRNEGIKPLLIKDFFLYDYIKNSRKKSKLHKLFEVLEANRNYSYVSASMQNVDRDDEHIQKVFEDFMNRRAALLQEEFYVRGFSLSIACMMNPKMASELYVSKNTFANGVLSTMMNKRTDPKLMAYIQLRQRNSGEFGMYESFPRLFVERLMIESMNVCTTGTSNNCLESIGHVDQLPENADPMKFKSLKKLARVCGYMLVASVVCLLFDKIRRKLKLVRKKRQRRRKRRARKVRAVEIANLPVDIV